MRTKSEFVCNAMTDDIAAALIIMPKPVCAERSFRPRASGANWLHKQGRPAGETYVVAAEVDLESLDAHKN